MQQIVKKDKRSDASAQHKENDSIRPAKTGDGLGLNVVQVHSGTVSVGKDSTIASSIKKGGKQGANFQSPPQGSIPPPPKRSANGASGKMTPNSQNNRSIDRLQ